MLDHIGFYTLTDHRAIHTCCSSPLYRCELLLTTKCNFNCVYCRKLPNHNITYQDAIRTVDLWVVEGLKNIRLSGGEPTLWSGLVDLVRYIKAQNIERIAISTNGSSDPYLYLELIKSGVNDFSISLDSCCSSTIDKMSGTKGNRDIIMSNIELLSKHTYVTIGIVNTQDNVQELQSTIHYLSKTHVADIRIIPAAQCSNQLLTIQYTTDKYPILSYRLQHRRSIRGLTLQDSNKCPLVLDDMAVFNNQHYPCIIYLREGGSPIGYVDHNIRLERYSWYKTHSSHKDPICRRNCLDVCVEYNNRVSKLNKIIG